MKHPIKIVIAPDSFKGSISAKEAANAIEKGIWAGLDDKSLVTLIKCPIADGGEGTLETLVKETDRITKTVMGTDGTPVSAVYGFTEDTAVIEMAAAAGLTLVEESKRDVTTATTYGVGELIADALTKGFRKILLTVGGSGTNDGGCGMFSALGARFFNKNGREFVPVGGTLHEIERIDLSNVDSRLSEAEITLATDVKNPLCGTNGATWIYAKQKGATDQQLEQMEAGMRHYAALIENYSKKDVAKNEGCGAGGGIATPLLAFCNAKLQSGIEAVLQSNDFQNKIRSADLIITGEGKLDAQSLFGKAVSGVANAAKTENIPVYCFVGCIGDDVKKLKSMGIADIFATSDIAPSKEYSMQHADELLTRMASDFIQKIL